SVDLNTQIQKEGTQTQQIEIDSQYMINKNTEETTETEKDSKQEIEIEEVVEQVETKKTSKRTLNIEEIMEIEKDGNQ
ncbi:1890_t:CDS:1, partial [Gigaspora margarita]